MLRGKKHQWQSDSTTTGTEHDERWEEKGNKSAHLLWEKIDRVSNWENSEDGKGHKTKLAKIGRTKWGNDVNGKPNSEH